MKNVLLVTVSDSLLQPYLASIKDSLGDDWCVHVHLVTKEGTPNGIIADKDVKKMDVIIFDTYYGDGGWADLRNLCGFWRSAGLLGRGNGRYVSVLQIPLSFEGMVTAPITRRFLGASCTWPPLQARFGLTEMLTSLVKDEVRAKAA